MLARSRRWWGLSVPHGVIITTVAAAHLEHFSSVEGIARAKAEILTGVRPGGFAILPQDNPYFDLLNDEAQRQGIARILPFGETADPEIGCQLVGYQADEAGGEVSLVCRGEAVRFHLSVPGKHQATNAAAVVLAAAACDVPIELAVSGLERFAAVGGRGATHRRQFGDAKVRLIDESYNANPASMAAALSVLGAAPGRRIAVLGDMMELGPQSPALHRGLADAIEAAGVAQVFCAGDAMAALAEALPRQRLAEHRGSASDLLDPLLGALVDGDVVLFKGSNASGIGRLWRGSGQGQQGGVAGEHAVSYLHPSCGRRRVVQRLSIHHLPNRRRHYDGVAHLLHLWPVPHPLDAGEARQGSTDPRRWAAKPYC